MTAHVWSARSPGLLPGPRDVCLVDSGEDPRQEPHQLHQRCAADVRARRRACARVWTFVWAPLPVCRPLHVAARRGLTVVVQELLAKEASVLAVDENGQLLSYLRLPWASAFAGSWFVRRLHAGAVLHAQPRRGRLFGAHPELHDAELPDGHHSSSACRSYATDGHQPPPRQQPHVQRRGIGHAASPQAQPRVLLQDGAPAVLRLRRRWTEWLGFGDLLRTRQSPSIISDLQLLRSLNISPTLDWGEGQQKMEAGESVKPGGASRVEAPQPNTVVAHYIWHTNTLHSDSVG